MNHITNEKQLFDAIKNSLSAKEMIEMFFWSRIKGDKLLDENAEEVKETISRSTFSTTTINPVNRFLHQPNNLHKEIDCARADLNVLLCFLITKLNFRFFDATQQFKKYGLFLWGQVPSHFANVQKKLTLK